MTTKNTDALAQLVALSDNNLELATEIKLLLDQAQAERALDQAVIKSQALVDNVAKTRRLVDAFQEQQATPDPEAT